MEPVEQPPKKEKELKPAWRELFAPRVGGSSSFTDTKREGSKRKTKVPAVLNPVKGKWSNAQIGAYDMRETNPNMYFYRFNKEGQVQKRGPWSMKEHARFMERLMEMGANEQWGIFSEEIEGRVGYQCSSYYRKLLERGWIMDPNYRKEYDSTKGVKMIHVSRLIKTDFAEKFRMFSFVVYHVSLLCSA